MSPISRRPAGGAPGAGWRPGRGVPAALGCFANVAPTAAGYRIGIDENGLGARLGPLIVTAALARVTREGAQWLAAGGHAALSADLGDSKVLASHADSRRGEAWARVLAEGPGLSPAASPAALFERLSLEGPLTLGARCPAAAWAQCWGTDGEPFRATDALVDRVRGHLRELTARGVLVERVLTSVVCTARLNEERAVGRSRFVVDLHAMERLLLRLRDSVDADVHAVCGKVGGIGDYPRFFGPLAGRLHSVLAAERAHSAYHLPGLGQSTSSWTRLPTTRSDARLAGRQCVRELFARTHGRFPQAPPQSVTCRALPRSAHGPLRGRDRGFTLSGPRAAHLLRARPVKKGEGPPCAHRPPKS